MFDVQPWFAPWHPILFLEPARSNPSSMAKGKEWGGLRFIHRTESFRTKLSLKDMHVDGIKVASLIEHTHKYENNCSNIYLVCCMGDGCCHFVDHQRREAWEFS